MKTAQDLQDIVDQAYDTFKANATNLAAAQALVNTALAAAVVAAKIGEYTCAVPLGDLTQLSANVIFLKRLVTDILTQQGFVVTFDSPVNQSWVSVDWTPDDFQAN